MSVQLKALLNRGILKLAGLFEEKNLRFFLKTKGVAILTKKKLVSIHAVNNCLLQELGVFIAYQAWSINNPELTQLG